MWKLDCEESWAPKNWCFWTVVLEKTLESPLDCKEIQPVHSEGDQPWVFFGRTDAKAETPILWPPQVKSWLIGKDRDAGRDWGQEEKLMTEHEMAGWHHQLDGHEFGWTPGVGDGQGGLVCCNSWGRKELDTTEWLNWTGLKHSVSFRCTAKWISYPYMYIHSFLVSFLIQVTTEYWVEFPVLYSRSLLVISLLVIYFLYRSVYMSISMFQFFPPHKACIFNHYNIHLMAILFDFFTTVGGKAY